MEKKSEISVEHILKVTEALEQSFFVILWAGLCQGLQCPRGFHHHTALQKKHKLNITSLTDTRNNLLRNHPIGECSIFIVIETNKDNTKLYTYLVCGNTWRRKKFLGMIY